MRIYLNGGPKDNQFIFFPGNQRIYIPIPEVPTLQDYTQGDPLAWPSLKTAVYQQTPFFIREYDTYVTVYQYVGTEPL